MNQSQYNQLFSFIWNIATDVLVYAFEKGEYKKIIMPMMVLRRIDVLLEPTKDQLLKQKQMLDDNHIQNQDPILYNVTGYPFYNTSKFTMKTLKSETAPNKLNDLLTQIEEANIYTEEEVHLLNEKYWGGATREEIDPIVNEAVERFKQLDDNGKIICKSSMRGFLRTYPFIAAVMPYKSLEWEMLETYFSLLIHKLPVLKGEDFTEGLIEAIDFDKYRLIKNEEKKIQL